MKKNYLKIAGSTLALLAIGICFHVSLTPTSSVSAGVDATDPLVYREDFSELTNGSSFGSFRVVNDGVNTAYIEGQDANWSGSNAIYHGELGALVANDFELSYDVYYPQDVVGRSYVWSSDYWSGSTDSPFCDFRLYNNSGANGLIYSLNGTNELLNSGWLSSKVGVSWQEWINVKLVKHGRIHTYYVKGVPVCGFTASVDSGAFTNLSFMNNGGLGIRFANFVLQATTSEETAINFTGLNANTSVGGMTSEKDILLKTGTGWSGTDNFYYGELGDSILDGFDVSFSAYFAAGTVGDVYLWSNNLFTGSTDSQFLFFHMDPTNGYIQMKNGSVALDGGWILGKADVPHDAWNKIALAKRGTTYTLKWNDVSIASGTYATATSAAPTLYLHANLSVNNGMKFDNLSIKNVQTESTFATWFSSAIATTCQAGQSRTAPSADLLRFWSLASARFARLSVEEQNALKTETPSSEGTLGEFVTKYEYILKKYGSSSFSSNGGNFLEKAIASPSFTGSGFPDDQAFGESAIFALLGTVLVLCGFALIRRRQEK